MSSESYGLRHGRVGRRQRALDGRSGHDMYVLALVVLRFWQFRLCICGDSLRSLERIRMTPGISVVGRLVLARLIRVHFNVVGFITVLIPSGVRMRLIVSLSPRT